jgi:AraC-like DNA-binding protein
VPLHVLVLTGTPLENRLEELISIVQVVDQHRLGPTWRLLHEHQQVDDAGRVIGYRDWTASATRWRRCCCAAARPRC